MNQFQRQSIPIAVFSISALIVFALSGWATWDFVEKFGVTPCLDKRLGFYGPASCTHPEQRLVQNDQDRNIYVCVCESP